MKKFHCKLHKYSKADSKAVLFTNVTVMAQHMRSLKNVKLKT